MQEYTLFKQLSIHCFIIFLLVSTLKKCYNSRDEIENRKVVINMSPEGKIILRKLLSFTRKACDDYDLINEGDKVCVGLSGGKDSMALLTTLANLKIFYPKKFELCAVMVSLGFEGVDTSPAVRYCEELGVPLTIVPTQIADVVFNIRKEKNPCALCANLRRGALNSAAKELGCNVVALAHHKDDVIETAMMSLFFEGRFYCFSPKTWLSKSELYVIRPFIYTEEEVLKEFAKTDDFPVIHNPCPKDKSSERSNMKARLLELEQENNELRTNIFGAVKKCVWTKDNSY